MASIKEVCTPNVIQKCETYCEQICDNQLNVRPYANKTGAVRVTRNLCKESCYGFCQCNQQQLEQKINTVDSPLAYALSEFYTQQQCFPHGANPVTSSLKMFYEQAIYIFKKSLKWIKTKINA